MSRDLPERGEEKEEWNNIKSPNLYRYYCNKNNVNVLIFLVLLPYIVFKLMDTNELLFKA